MANKSKTRNNGKARSSSNRGRRPDSINYKGSRNEKAYDKGERNGSNESYRETYNDASWYANNTQLLSDAASLAYSNPVGAKVNFFEGSDIDYGTNVGDPGPNTSVPGVMAINITPVPGSSKDNSSAVNIAARNLYSFVRHANSGHSNYDSPDLMMYILAMDSLYSMYAHLTRAYGVMRTYAQKNRYTPKALITAMGFDFDDLESHLADFRYYLNTISVKLGSMCTPASMSYVTRHAWLYSNVYADAPLEKSQYYVFVPELFWQFSETTPSQPGLLEPIKWAQPAHSTPWSFEAVKTMVDNMLASVIQSEDMNIMSGDILKAFGDSGVLKLNTIPEDFTVVPVYNEEVLSQIQNSTIIPVTVTPVTQDVSTGPLGGAIKIGITYNIRGKLWPTNRIINMRKMVVSPADTMVASRLTVLDGARSNTGAQTDFICGSEIASGASMYFFEDLRESTGNYTWELVRRSIQSVMTPFNDLPLSSGMVATVMQTVSLLEKFDWHPCVYMPVEHYADSGDLDGYVLGGFFMDLDNYTTVDRITLGKMHETALLSEFSVPQYGAYQGN